MLKKTPARSTLKRDVILALIIKFGLLSILYYLYIEPTPIIDVNDALLNTHILSIPSKEP